jgi:hypothetical protein
MYPKHTSRLWMFDSSERIPFSTQTTPQWIWMMLLVKWLTSFNQRQLKLIVHKVWICCLNLQGVVTAREIIMGEETFSCTLCTFVQPVLCLRINCKTNNTDWNKSWGGVLIWHSEDRASRHILIIKPTRCTISQIYFGIELCMFQTVSPSIIRSPALYTQQLSYRLCWLLATGIRMGLDCHLSLSLARWTPSMPFHKLVKELPVFHPVHNCLSLVPFLSQMNPVCAFPSSEYTSDWLLKLGHGINWNYHCKTCVPGWISHREDGDHNIRWNTGRTSTYEMAKPQRPK